MRTLTTWSLAAGVVCSLLTANLNAGTWVDNATDNNFSTTGNWTGGAPGSNAALVFGTSNQTNLNNDLGAVTVGNITFNAGADAFIISGGTLTAAVNNGEIRNKSANLQTILSIRNTANLYLRNDTGAAGLALGKVDMARGVNVISELNNTTLTIDTLLGHTNTFQINGTGGSVTIKNAIADDERLWISGPNINRVNPLQAEAVRTALTIENLGGSSYVILTDRLFGGVTITGSNAQIGTSDKLQIGYGVDVTLDYTSGSYNKFSRDGTTDLYASTLKLKDPNNYGYQETVNTLWIGRDDSKLGGLVRIESVSGSATLYTGTLTRLGNGAGNTGRSVLEVAGDNILAAGNADGSSQGWFTIVQNGRRDWAVKGSGSSFYVALMDTDYTALSDSVGTAGTDNVLNGILTANYASTKDQNLRTLKISGGSQLTIATRLALLGNGLLYTGAGDYLITGGALQGATNNTELIVWQSGAGTLTINSQLNVGTGGFTKAGDGTLVISSSNNYTGYTTIDGGKVVLGDDHALGSGNNRLILNTGTIDLNGHNLSVSTLHGYGYMVGTAAVVNYTADTAEFSVSVDPAGTLREANGLPNTYLDGNIHLTLSGAPANVYHANNHTGGTTLVGNTAFRIYNAGFFGSGPLELRNGGGWQIQNDSANLIGFTNFDKTLTITGTGNYISYDGQPFVLTGTLLGSGEFKQIGNLNGTGGMFTLNSSDAGQFTGTIVAQSNGDNGRVRTTINNLDLSNGTLVLSASNNRVQYFEYAGTGNATIKVGNLTSESAGSTEMGGNRAIVRNLTSSATATFEIGGGTFAGHITNNGSAAANGALSDSGNNTAYVTALTKVGTGTLTLTNASTYTGSTTVSGGVLLLSGAADLTRTGAVTVSGGTLAFSDNAVISSGARVTVDSGVLLVNNSAFATAGKKLDINAGGVLGGSGVIGTDEIEFKAPSAGVTGGGLGEVGTLTFSGDQSWENFTYYFDILSDSVHDLLSFGGYGLDLHLGTQFTLNVNNLGGLDFNEVPIISGLDLYYFGDPGDMLNLWALPSSDYTLSLSDDGRDLLLSYSAQQIPEPSAWLLLSLGAALLVTLRRRK